MIYYRHFVGDFAILTQGLDLESVGIASRLFDRYTITEKPITTQWVSLAFHGETEKKALAILDALFVRCGDGWVYPPITEQIIDYHATAEKNRRNGSKGGRPKKATANPTETQTKPTAPTGETQTEAKKTLVTSQESLVTSNKEINKESAPAKRTTRKTPEKPDDVSDQVWTEWLALRKAKRAQVTPFILDRIRKQAERVPAKYGFTFEDALLMMIDAQWTGFEAEWVVNRLSRTGGRATAAPQGFTRELSAEERARNPGFGITQEDIDEALMPLTPEEIAALSPHQDDVPPFDEALTLH